MEEGKNESATRLPRKQPEAVQLVEGKGCETDKAVSSQKKKGRKGNHEQDQNQNSLAPKARSLKPRPLARPRSHLDAATTVPSTSSLNPSSTSIPRVPILLSHSKTPRISIAPRPPSPPPPVHDLSPAVEALSISARNGPKTLSLRHLPPLLLSIEIPSEYPESSGPSKIDLTAEGGWLEETNRLVAIEKLKSGKSSLQIM